MVTILLYIHIIFLCGISQCDKSKIYLLIIKDFKNCLQVCDGVDYIFNLACNMGGMGFIE